MEWIREQIVIMKRTREIETAETLTDVEKLLDELDRFKSEEMAQKQVSAYFRLDDQLLQYILHCFFHNCEVALSSHICFSIRLVFHQHLNSRIAYPGSPLEPSRVHDFSVRPFRRGPFRPNIRCFLTNPNPNPK